MTAQLNNTLTAASQIDNQSDQEMILSAELAGMRYVTDAVPGFSRKKMAAPNTSAPAKPPKVSSPQAKPAASSYNFRYLDKTGKPLKDAAHLKRIKSLAIPPAWTDVWISPWHNSHIQATGRDARNRKQYRYHARWREVRDEAKYERMMNFGLHLPELRQRVDQDMKRPGLCKEKVLATIVNLLELTMMRIGNEEYAKTNQSFGITTLRNKHVHIEGKALEFHFRGKSRVDHNIKLTHPRLARIIKHLRELPGQELFQYVDDDGVRHSIGSADVNDYLQQLSGEHYTAKDFRTWSGTVQAAMALQALGPASTEKEAKKNIVHAIEAAAKKLGNTPTICKKCYVHPVLMDSYLDGSMFGSGGMQLDKEQPAPALSEIELFILKLLQQRMQSEQHA